MRRTVVTWIWPETMTLLRLLVQRKSVNECAAALGKSPNQIQVRIGELCGRYPDVMERIMDMPTSAYFAANPQIAGTRLSINPQKEAETSGISKKKQNCESRV